MRIRTQSIGYSVCPRSGSQPPAASAWAGVGFQVDRCGSSRNGIACACTEEVVTAAALTPPQWQASGCLLAAVSLAVLAAVHVTHQTPVNLVGSWFTPKHLCRTEKQGQMAHVALAWHDWRFCHLATQQHGASTTFPFCWHAVALNTLRRFRYSCLVIRIATD